MEPSFRSHNSNRETEVPAKVACDMTAIERESVYDVFLSYAGEDQDLAAALRDGLENNGIRVWFAPIQLQPGTSVLGSIEQGMLDSRTGIVLLSPAYLGKPWPEMERNVLQQAHIEAGKDLFPIWHGVSKADVERLSPYLAGLWAVMLPSVSEISAAIRKLVRSLARNASTVLINPTYESPAHRFLSGRGELLIGENGPATTLWELLLHSSDDSYPVYLYNETYSKNDLLWRVAELLPQIPQQVEMTVGEAGRARLWLMCREAGFDPVLFA